MKTLFLALIATVAIAGTARAQEPKAHDHEHAQPPAVADQKGDAKPMAGMAMMKASMDAQDKKIDALVAELNAAKGNDRVDKLVALVNELVTERKAMHEHMMGMHEHMMGMMKDK